MTGDTLPLTVGHLHPRIGPALIHYEWLSRPIGALPFYATRGDGGIAKDRHLQIVVLDAVVFGRFD
jgi:hypothetical protein